VLHDEFDAHSSRQVEYDVGSPDYIVDQVCVQDRAQHELEVLSTIQVLDICEAAGGQVVEHSYSISTRQ
jgi:hypothetical protein